MKIVADLPWTLLLDVILLLAQSVKIINWKTENSIVWTWHFINQILNVFVRVGLREQIYYYLSIVFFFQQHAILLTFKGQEFKI